jgi:hypothetical protein
MTCHQNPGPDNEYTGNKRGLQNFCSKIARWKVTYRGPRHGWEDNNTSQIREIDCEDMG